MDLITYAVLSKKIDAIGDIPDEKITEAVNAYLAKLKQDIINETTDRIMAANSLYTICDDEAIFVDEDNNILIFNN